MGLIDWNIYPLINKSLDDLPKVSLDDPYYILSKDGFHLRKKILHGEVIIPHKEIPNHLDAIDSKNGILWYEAPPVPLSIMNQTLTLFRTIWDKQETEAEILLLYNDEIKQPSKRFKILVPQQKVTGASVNSEYDPTDIEGNWQLFGSIHSHCNFSAFHSGTDLNDASDFTGLHITIGHVDTDNPTYASMVMVGGIKFDFEIGEVANVTGIRSNVRIPEDWVDLIEKSVYVAPPKGKWVQAPTTNNKPGYQLPVPTYPWNSKKNSSGAEGWSKNEKELRWSFELKSYFPKHYFTGESANRIKDEFVIDAVGDALDSIKEAAKNRGISISWDFEDVSPLAKQMDGNEASSNSDEADWIEEALKDYDTSDRSELAHASRGWTTNWKDRLSDFLPGAFGMSDGETDDDSEWQQVLREYGEL